jgi:putative SOS response-associated peptidase YedK
MREVRFGSIASIWQIRLYVRLAGNSRHGGLSFVKEGETTNDLFAFLTCEPNKELGAIHPKAMPVILPTPAEIETWMTAPTEEAVKLQRPLPDGSLQIVARGAKTDEPG